MNVRKMYVIPSDFFDSLMRKSRITEDPLITAQLKIEKEKDKLLSQPNKDADIKLRDYTDKTHKQLILEEQRKQKPPEIVTKKTGRPRKENFPEFDLGNMFYDFEPDGVEEENIIKTVRQARTKKTRK